MRNKSQGPIDTLNAKIAVLELENAKLRSENKQLRDTEDGGQMRTCPSCRNRYLDVLAYWPGYLIPGELRCAGCYAASDDTRSRSPGLWPSTSRMARSA